MLRARGWLWLLALSVGCVFFGVPAMAQGQPEEEAHGIFARSAETVQWSEELRTIVLTHPQAKIRDTLNTLILTQVVLLAFDDDIALGGDGEATILLMPVDGAGVQIVLNIKPSLLDGGTPTAEQYRVVFHEYVHIEQLFAGSPAEYFFARDGSLPCDEAEAMTVFRNEVDAYCQECQLAVEMGWPTDDPLCSAYVSGGAPALARTLAAALASRGCFVQHRVQLESYAQSLSSSSLVLPSPR